MLRQSLCLVLSIAALAASSGCHQAASDGLPGTWHIDMNATLDQARSLGASAADVEGVRRTFDGGLMTVTADTITLSLSDSAGASTLSYHLESTAGECSTLKVQGSSEPQRFCVAGPQLKVHDPSTPLVVVYRRG